MTHACRLCGAALEHVFADLGMCPLANGFLRADQLDRMERFYPLTARVCARCFLVQLPVAVTPESIFGDYAYFSSYSDSWLAHARAYCEAMKASFSIDRTKLVIEIASNDGYLLQYFAAAGVAVLGIEPAANVAATARGKGIETIERFFGRDLARELADGGRRPDLLIANNVLAHVPDLHDFIEGLSILLPPAGILTVEVPHLMRLLAGVEFDTIYHEHFSYFSLRTLQQALALHGLAIFDVEELPTHGGSLRIYAAHASSSLRPSARVGDLLATERQNGLTRMDTYVGFQHTVSKAKRSFLHFLLDCAEKTTSIAAYGAPAKGNTLLNYCGVRGDLLPFTVDRNPHKQGLFLPGTHIPVYAPERVDEVRPEYLLILPWNVRDEIVQQMARIRSWGGKFVVAIPEVDVFS